MPREFCGRWLGLRRRVPRRRKALALTGPKKCALNRNRRHSRATGKIISRRYRCKGVEIRSQKLPLPDQVDSRYLSRVGIVFNQNWVTSLPVALENQSKFVQVDRHAYEVTGVREGGFGKVWLLKRRTEQWDYIYGPVNAVKTFNVYDDEQEAVIEHELGNWISLQSPHIVSLIKIVRLNFELGALMLLMPGSLYDYLRGHGPLDTPLIKAVLLDVARGPADAQAQANLAHLDLKPQNLLLISADSPRVRISDWGLSRIASQQRQHSDWLRAPRAWLERQTSERTKFDGGTPPYMAPERFSGSWKIGPAADVFSLGIIGVQLMTGKCPTVDPNGDIYRIIDLITSHRYFERAETLTSSGDGRLGSLLLKMIDPNPDRRPSDYQAIIAALDAV